MQKRRPAGAAFSVSHQDVCTSIEEDPYPERRGYAGRVEITHMIPLVFDIGIGRENEFDFGGQGEIPRQEIIHTAAYVPPDDSIDVILVTVPSIIFTIVDQDIHTGSHVGHESLDRQVGKTVLQSKRYVGGVEIVIISPPIITLNPSISNIELKGKIAGKPDDESASADKAGISFDVGVPGFTFGRHQEPDPPREADPSIDTVCRCDCCREQHAG